MVWVITIKYLFVMMRADNNGEGLAVFGRLVRRGGCCHFSNRPERLSHPGPNARGLYAPLLRRTIRADPRRGQDRPDLGVREGRAGVRRAVSPAGRMLAPRSTIAPPLTKLGGRPASVASHARPEISATTPVA
jgi:hypothetical protein